MPHMISIGAMVLRLRQRYAHGLRVAYYRNRVRPRILQTPPMPETDDRVCEIHVLTSKQDWLNLVWTLKSFYRTSGRRYALCIHDDGSLGAEEQHALLRHFPQARVIDRAEADRRMETVLQDHPRCRQFRFSNHLAPKVFDFAAYLETERMLLLDSDLLFFAEPVDLLQRIEDPRYRKNTVNGDIASAYTTEAPVALRHTGVELIERFNSGLGLIHRGSLRLEWIEEFLGIPGILGHSWRIEQTLFALCSSRFGVELLPPEYDVYLSRGLGNRVSRHYVGAIRHMMYREGMARLVRHGFLNGGKG
jgi:hypothetical protein